MFYIKSPAPFFRHPPQREHSHGFPQLTCQGKEVCERRERVCAYSPIPCARDTPCFSATPWYTPSPSLVVGPPQQQRLHPQPRRYSIAPSQPEQPTGIAQPGRGNTQNRHSNSRSPAAPTEIFNDPLNLPEKGNCHNLTISPNTSQMLRFAPVSSCFLALSRFLFAVSLSFATLSVEYIYNTPRKKYIFISLG